MQGSVDLRPDAEVIRQRIHDLQFGETHDAEISQFFAESAAAWGMAELPG